MMRVLKSVMSKSLIEMLTRINSSDTTRMSSVAMLGCNSLSFIFHNMSLSEGKCFPYEPLRVNNKGNPNNYEALVSLGWPR